MGDPLSAGQAIVLGIIQGLTEFLPVSSSGHLALAEAYLRIPGGGIAVAVLLHAGTLLAILLVFPAGARQLVVGAVELVRRPLAGPGGWSPDANLTARVACTTAPGAIAGLILAPRVEAVFADPRIVGVFLLVTASLLLATRRAARDGDVTWSAAWIIGIAQACAILPGISRSGATITVALLIGVSRPLAAEYSFLAAIPLVFGSLLVSLPELGSSAAQGSAPALGAGFVTAFLVGWGALAWLVRLVRRGQLFWFSIYCAVIGILILVWPPGV